MQELWTAGGKFSQRQWDTICQLFNHNNGAMVVWGITLLTFTVYWGLGFFYTILDFTGKPTFLLKYCIQDKKSTISSALILRIVRQVLVNQILVGIPYTIIMYYAMVWKGYDTSRTLPTFQRMVFEIIIFLILEETGFYYFHRFFHHPFLYKRIHKQHHEFTAPIAIAAIYCHPIEHIIINMLPASFGHLLLGSHVSTTWLWYMAVIFATITTHSGFHFPFFPPPEAHDYHHMKFNQNYGSLGVLDRLHGTDSEFLKSKQYQRHTLLLSLRPVTALYPDDQKKF